MISFESVFKQDLGYLKISLVPVNTFDKRIREMEIKEFVEFPPDGDKTSKFVTYEIRKSNTFIGWIRINETPPDKKEKYFGKKGKEIVDIVSGSIGISGFFILEEHRNKGIGEHVLRAFQNKHERIFYPAGNKEVHPLLKRLGFIKFRDGKSDGIESYWMWGKNDITLETFDIKYFNSLTDKKAILYNEDYGIYYTIVCNGDKVGVIGFIYFSTYARHLQIVIDKKHRRKGIFREALKKLMDKHNIKKIYATIYKSNTDSIKAHEKIGFIALPNKDQLELIKAGRISQNQIRYVLFI